MCAQVQDKVLCSRSNIIDMAHTQTLIVIEVEVKKKIGEYIYYHYRNHRSVVKASQTGHTTGSVAGVDLVLYYKCVCSIQQLIK